MAAERKGVVTMRNNPITLVGPEIKVGQKAPDFKAVGKGLAEVSSDQFKGKARIYSAVPSLDTPVCDTETRRFNEEAAKLPGDAQIVTISMDLPFAQARWCGAAGVDKVTTLSDYKYGDFGEKYGTLMKENKLLARAVFVVDRKDKVTHVEYVKDVTSEPSYEAAIEALKKASAA